MMDNRISEEIDQVKKAIKLRSVNCIRITMQSSCLPSDLW